MSSVLPLLTTPLDTATPLRAMGQQQNDNALNHEQVLGKYYENLDAREKSRLSSVISGAVQLEQFLDNNDLDGAHNFLVQRRNQLQNRIGSGENIDTEDTDAALDMLRKGNIDELKSSIQGLKVAGQVYGVLSKADMPANIQEWLHYNSLPKEQQAEYLNMKRASQQVNTGNNIIIPNQVDPAGTPQATFPVAPKPDNDPDLMRRQEEAKMEGRGEVPEKDKLNRGKSMVTNLVNKVIPQVEGLGASGGAISTQADTATNLWAAVKSTDVGQFVQRISGTEEQSIRNKIKTQKPALINAIRNATGMSAKAMDSNTELQFYLQQVGDEKTDTESQLFALKMIDEMYGAGGAQIPAGNDRVRIRDPKTGKTGTVSASQAEAAQQQGYEIIQ